MPSEKILIVDDEEGMRKLLARVLIKHGYEAVIAGSGDEALSLVESDTFDLIITDINMPGMDLYGSTFASSQLTDADGIFDLALPPGENIVVARKRKNGELFGPILAGDNRSGFISLTVTGDQEGLTIVAPPKVDDSRRLTARSEG